MVAVYTDASVANGEAVATCFIVSSDNFIGYNSFFYKDVSSSLHGELLGIRDGLRYAVSIVGSAEDITLYSDSNSALDMCKRGCDDNSKCAMQFRNIVSEIKDICSGHYVNFLLIKGHQVGHNPNKVVDLVSYSLLRQNKEERK